MLVTDAEKFESTEQRWKNFWVQIIKIEVNGAFASIIHISEKISLKIERLGCFL